jgi:FkbM family methyltransferase
MTMGFLKKKVHLIGFLTRRIPRHGLSQWMRGVRERKMSYLAMELAELLPPDASTIVDVGAHTGLLADALDFLFSPRRLWVVEPNPAHGRELEERFRGRPQFSVTKTCLGERRGEVTFNVYEFDAASSLYACRAGHMASLGLSEESKSISVPMTTLRELLPPDLATLDLLKLDCQGAELAVLKGAGERIRAVRWIYCEVSIDAIYEGAPLFGGVHAFLRGSGFELRRLGSFSGAGRSIQWADALYANVSLVSG